MEHARMVWKSLKKNVDMRYQDDQGALWGHVFLDWARPHKMSPDEYKKVLTYLATQGLYESIDEAQEWGAVKLNKRKNRNEGEESTWIKRGLHKKTQSYRKGCEEDTAKDNT